MLYNSNNMLGTISIDIRSIYILKVLYVQLSKIFAHGFFMKRTHLASDLYPKFLLNLKSISQDIQIKARSAFCLKHE